MAESKSTVRALDVDGVADVLHFLHNVLPIDGCDYKLSVDPEFTAGRNRILEYLEESLRASSPEEVVHG